MDERKDAVFFMRFMLFAPEKVPGRQAYRPG